MKTQLEQGTGRATQPASSNVFGVISSALARTGRQLGCWDTNRFDDGSQRRDVMPDPSVTHENLAYAYATS
ncbi:MAG: hypothetical protein JST44_07110 [Cyanobacteria bacterium SZAS LIN-5]|nr:hypothetical protein [Cyanobacteria bacterium SZAS LIN-5]RTL41796.1 MAG: hypothetical protein EKK48_12825 [Candidatus Melainabacteria bacterium]